MPTQARFFTRSWTRDEKKWAERAFKFQQDQATLLGVSIEKVKVWWRKDKLAALYSARARCTGRDSKSRINGCGASTVTIVRRPISNPVEPLGEQ